ncbi:50S ribosomal protein L21 [Candidatus Profftia sp. (ex Adelges kitamiensis)]|uniref:50S ribosomal protein L21 n=1 Tax=Candidatus Profftia sp. (ex Adelges kitamiensis) TaxID=2864218 RepID=UPI001CE28B82|nr:50S ribosomal protein L21 [Candidatus Profftia sp. (ex Adelges kitamiensis)]
MYAVFRSGGKQHRVNESQIIRVEKLNLAVGENIEFNDILMVVNSKNVKIGVPIIPSCKVTAKIIAHGRSNKIMIVKFRRRKHYRKQQGHRQWFTDVKIISIST